MHLGIYPYTRWWVLSLRRCFPSHIGISVSFMVLCCHNTATKQTQKTFPAIKLCGSGFLHKQSLNSWAWKTALFLVSVVLQNCGSAGHNSAHTNLKETGMLDDKLTALRLSTSFHQRDRTAALERLLHSPYFSRNKLQMAFWKLVSVSTCSWSLKIFGLWIQLSSDNILQWFVPCIRRSLFFTTQWDIVAFQMSTKYTDL